MGQMGQAISQGEHLDFYFVFVKYESFDYILKYAEFNWSYNFKHILSKENF